MTDYPDWSMITLRAVDHLRRKEEEDLVQVNVKDEPCKSWSNDANEPIDIDGEKEFTQVTNGRKRGPPENGSSPSDPVKVSKAARVDPLAPVSPSVTTQSARVSPPFKRFVHIKAEAGEDLFVGSNSIRIFAELKNVDSRISADQVIKARGYLIIACCDEPQVKKFSQLDRLANKIVLTTVEEKPQNAANLNPYNVIIFGVHESITDAEIMDETGAIAIRRLQKFDHSANQKIITRNVVLSFKTNPPTEVRIGLEVHRTATYIPKTIRCFKCQRFGHISSSCRGRFKCPNCAGDHSFDQCPNRERPIEEQVRKCVNCGGPHSAAFTDCPAFKDATNITHIKVHDHISYAQAVMKHRNMRANVNALQMAPQTSSDQNDPFPLFPHISQGRPIISGFLRREEDSSVPLPNKDPVIMEFTVEKPCSIINNPGASINNAPMFQRDNGERSIPSRPIENNPPPGPSNFGSGASGLHPHLTTDDPLTSMLSALPKESLVNLLLRFIESIARMINPSVNTNELSSIFTAIVCPSTSMFNIAQSSR